MPKETLIKIGSILLLVIVIGALFSLALCKGEELGRSKEVVKEQARTIEVQKKTGEVNDQAASERVADAVKLEQQRKELTDATCAAFGSDDRRACRGCIILRQQGRPEGGSPACRRFEGGPGAPVPAGSPAAR